MELAEILFVRVRRLILILTALVSNPQDFFVYIRHYCITQLGERYVTGVCNGGCFEEDGSKLSSFFLNNFVLNDELKNY